jgi:hypothetical protein
VKRLEPQKIEKFLKIFIEGTTFRKPSVKENAINKRSDYKEIDNT